MVQERKNYTLGKGRVFFGRYANNVTITDNTKSEGERFFGNAPAFSTTSTSENLDHYQSTGGVRVKDDSVQLQLDRTGSVNVDDISPDNQALFLLGVASSVVATSSTGLSETYVVQRDRSYQLGVTQLTPSGMRALSNIVIQKIVGGNPTTVNVGANLEIDAVRGRFYVNADAPDIADGDTLQVTFDRLASERSQVLSGSDSIYGELRFLADNPKGTNSDYYFPYVKMAPDGDYSLIGDEWMSIGFTFEILRKGNLPSVIVDGQPRTTI